GRLAARFGFGPRPTQTAYEYATALGEILPGIRPELQTVATAKVEVAYGGRILGDDRIQAIRASYAKLRVGLLRLLARRVARRRIKLSSAAPAKAPPSGAFRRCRRGPPRRGPARGGRRGSSPGPAAGRRGSRSRRSRRGRTTTSRTARAAGRTASAAGP